MNVVFDHGDIMVREQKGGRRAPVFADMEDHEPGCYDVMEHDVLLEQRNPAAGTRVLAAFSSLSNMSAANYQRFEHEYKYAGLAVTPYGFKLGVL